MITDHNKVCNSPGHHNEPQGNVQKSKRLPCNGLVHHQENTENQWCAWQSYREEDIKNITARLQFSQGHLNKTEGYWKNVLWTEAGPSAAQQKGIM